jgi:DNA-binding XRE family transcriptional regulator
MVIDCSEMASDWESLPKNQAGLYAFLENDTPVYIGRSRNLRERVRSHFSTRTELKDGRWTVRYHPCPLEESIENELDSIQHYQPKHNTALRVVRPGRQGTSRPKPKSGRALAPTNMARLVKALRWHEDLTIREVASVLGIESNAVFRIEKGKGINDANLKKFLCWVLQ